MLFPFFLNYLLFAFIYFLIPGIIIQIFIPSVELVIPIGIPTNEAKAEMDTHPVTVAIIISKSDQHNSKLYKVFDAVYSFIYFDLFLQSNNLLFHLFFAV